MRKRLVAAAGIGMTAAATLAFSFPAGSASAASGPSVTYQAITASPQSGGGGAGKGNDHGTGNRGKDCNPTPVYPMSTAQINIGPSTQSAVDGKYTVTGTYTCNGQSLRGHHLSITLTALGVPAQTVAGRACGFTKYHAGGFTCVIAASGSGLVTVNSKSTMSNAVIVTQ